MFLARNQSEKCEVKNNVKWPKNEPVSKFLVITISVFVQPRCNAGTVNTGIIIPSAWHCWPGTVGLALSAWHCQPGTSAWHCQPGTVNAGIITLALSAWHCLPGTVSMALSAWHCLLGTVCLALSAWHCLPGTVSLALSAWHCEMSDKLVGDEMSRSDKATN